MTLGLKAVVWDFDGTLVDTRIKNLAVNRRIIESVTGRSYGDFPALSSLEAYNAAMSRARNWREFYRQEYGLDEATVDRAGRLWTGYQLADTTPAALYEGIPEILESLSGIPHGIVSQNGAENIRSLLRRDGLDAHFTVVIGFEEVPFTRQKPEPDGLLQCIEALSVAEPGVILYVGDHPTDTECASNANQALAAKDKKNRVIAVAACFDGPAGCDRWRIPPDHVVLHPREIIGIAARYQA